MYVVTQTINPLENSRSDDQEVIDIILTLQSRLEHHWRIDVSIPTVITLLLHIANSLPA